MALSFEATQAHFSRGEYAAIAEQCDLRKTQAGLLTPKHRVLIAQAAFQHGNIPLARATATRECASASTPELRARYEAILGLIERRHGNWELAEKHFWASLRDATEAKHLKQIGWSYLWLFRTLAELGPPDRAAAMLPQVRTAVAKAGDSHLSAYMHDSLALMEASAGRTQEAGRHLQITEGMLERFPNAWLTQRLLLSKSFISFLECRYDETLLNLRRARDLAPIAGAGLLPIIDCNEAHVLSVMGNFSAAEKRLRKVAESDSPQIALGALEGLARIHLATNRLDECQATLQQCESLAREPGLASAFAGRGNSVTRLKLLLQLRAFQDAGHEAERYLETARRLDDKVLSSTLTFLSAEAAAANGRIAEAVRLLFPFLATDSIGGSGQQVAFYRALGVVLLRADAMLGELMFERAHALCAAQGNRSAALELDQLGAQRRFPSGWSKTRNSAATVIEILSAAFNLAGKPSVLASQLLAAAKLLGCQATIKTERSLASKAGTDQAAQLELGIERGKRVSFTCSVPDDPVKAIALASLLRLARAAIELNRVREDQRRRAALWPAAPVEEQAGALFTGEEMQRLLDAARRVAGTTASVLITGETGTGKEVLARTIHGYSNRARAPFLPFNCTATPKDMLDSQLFGHRRGAFTGATESFPGIIRGAAGGTLFLDEIGDMPLDMQPKLLRFLESSEIHPIGETHPVRVDVRVIAATNANLDALVADGRFREDLFYRLNIVRLHLPPLRERRMEIPALANHYLQKYAQEYGKGDLRLAEETIEYLLLYRWPGNIRQLANEIRRMAALCEAGAVLMPEHLSQEIAASRRTVPASERVLESTELVVRLDQPLAAAQEHLERAMLQYALRQCNGRIEDTAAMLGLSRKGLYLKRQRFGIEPPEATQAAPADTARQELKTSGLRGSDRGAEAPPLRSTRG